LIPGSARAAGVGSTPTETFNGSDVRRTDMFRGQRTETLGLMVTTTTTRLTGKETVTGQQTIVTGMIVFLSLILIPVETGRMTLLTNALTWTWT
jgi:hypothetical protein